ncbi:MAG: hypothetical protein ACKVIQ_11880 [Acidimicrobiales bacterium]
MTLVSLKQVLFFSAMVAMTRLVACLMVVLLMAGVVLAQAPTADACSLAPSFIVTAQHLGADDVNALSSQIGQDYRSCTGDQAAEIQVLGV